jgi:hypothetical protein
MIQAEIYPTLFHLTMHTDFVKSTLLSELLSSGEEEDLLGRFEVSVRWGCRVGGAMHGK